jgi:hypothetical protein
MGLSALFTHALKFLREAGMAKERPAHETSEDQLRFRLEAGSFALEEAEHRWAPATGCETGLVLIALGNISHEFSATLIRWRHS